MSVCVCGGRWEAKNIRGMSWRETHALQNPVSFPFLSVFFQSGLPRRIERGFHAGTDKIYMEREVENESRKTAKTRESGIRVLDLSVVFNFSNTTIYSAGR